MKSKNILYVFLISLVNFTSAVMEKSPELEEVSLEGLTKPEVDINKDNKEELLNNVTLKEDSEIEENQELWGIDTRSVEEFFTEAMDGSDLRSMIVMKESCFDILNECIKKSSEWNSFIYKDIHQEGVVWRICDLKTVFFPKTIIHSKDCLIAIKRLKNLFHKSNAKIENLNFILSKEKIEKEKKFTREKEFEKMIKLCSKAKKALEQKYIAISTIAHLNLKKQCKKIIEISEFVTLDSNNFAPFRSCEKRCIETLREISDKKHLFIDAFDGIGFNEATERFLYSAKKLLVYITSERHLVFTEAVDSEKIVLDKINMFSETQQCWRVIREIENSYNLLMDTDKELKDIFKEIRDIEIN